MLIKAALDPEIGRVGVLAKVLDATLSKKPIRTADKP